MRKSSCLCTFVLAGQVSALLLSPERFVVCNDDQTHDVFRCFSILSSDLLHVLSTFAEGLQHRTLSHYKG